MMLIVTKPPKYCENCSLGEEETKLKVCASCHTVYYCGTTCQKNDWKSHKHVCNKTPSSENTANDHKIKYLRLRANDRKNKKKALKELFKRFRNVVPALRWEELFRVGILHKRAAKMTGRSTTQGKELLQSSLNFLLVSKGYCRSNLHNYQSDRKIARVHWLLGNRQSAVPYFVSSTNCVPFFVGIHIRSLFRLCRAAISCEIKFSYLQQIKTFVSTCQSIQNKNEYYLKIYRYQMTIHECNGEIELVYQVMETIKDELNPDFCLCCPSFYELASKLFLREGQLDKALPRAERYLSVLVASNKREKQIEARKTLRSILVGLERTQEAEKQDVHIRVLSRERDDKAKKGTKKAQ